MRGLSFPARRAALLNSLLKRKRNCYCSFHRRSFQDLLRARSLIKNQVNSTEIRNKLTAKDLVIFYTFVKSITAIFFFWIYDARAGQVSVNEGGRNNNTRKPFLKNYT